MVTFSWLANIPLDVNPLFLGVHARFWMQVHAASRASHPSYSQRYRRQLW
jgi:hypothetical protein